MTNRHHFHLIVGHLPALGVFIGIALLIWGLAIRSPDVKQASLGLFVVCALATAATVATGDAAKDGVLNLPGINRESIQRHAAAGKLAAIPSYLLGAVSMGGLLWGSRLEAGDWIDLVVLIMALIAGVMLARASRAAGLIRHSQRDRGAVAERTERQLTGAVDAH